MTEKRLILFSKTYPFGKGEQYITNELLCLSRCFEKVIIYPNDYYDANMQHDKTLPGNIEVLNFNSTLSASSSNNSIGDYLYLAKITLYEFLKTDDKKSFFGNFKWNLTNFWTQYQIAKRFTEYLDDNNYKHTTVFYSYWFHKSAILLSILKDKKKIGSFVSRAHSIDLYHNDWGIINEKVKVPPFKMFKLKHASAIWPVSEHGSAYLKGKYPVFAPKIATRYLGVQDHFENQKKTTGAFHIVTCSGIDYNKRVHLLAEALLSVTHEVFWVHFGTGDMINELKKIASRFPESISLSLKGNTSNKAIHEYYSEHHVDLFVNLSIVEGLPVSIMEAMSYNIPILATAVYGTPEAVIDKKNGFLLDVNFTVPELTDKINYCIENRQELRKMGEESREIYLNQFDAEKNYRQFANYLASL